MQEILTQPKEPVISFDVHKLYRPVEFKLTTIYDASKPDGKGNSKALELAKSSEIKEVKNEFEHHTAWKNVYRMGPGLRNAGNTCFLNSVLQMLTYTSPFANYLLDKGHSNKCQRRNSSQFCALCAFENHVNKCFLGGGNAFEPYEILKNIKLINKKFSIGRQEDSQEFLRDLIDAFQKSCTGFLEKPPQKVLDNTDISKIFGGKLKSSVECKQCHHKSEIFENFFDLSLELSKSESIEKCLDIFFKAEELKGANRYRCSNCNKLVDATKKFSIQQRPVVLTIHLKRFDNYMTRINKISKHINFHETLSLQSYVSEKTSDPLIYDLQGIVIHMGSFCSSGHYYAYVKNSNGIWHLANDSDVRTSKVDNVLKQDAYLLTYVLRSSPKKVEVPKALMQKAENKNTAMEIENIFNGKQKDSTKINGVMVNGILKPAKLQGPQKETMVVENKKTTENNKMQNVNKDKMEVEKTEKMKKQEETRTNEKKSSRKASEENAMPKINANAVIEDLFAKNKPSAKQIEQTNKTTGNDIKTQQQPNQAKKSDMVIEKENQEKSKKTVEKDLKKENRVNENEKIPYSERLGALLDQKDAKIYMKKLENISTQKNASMKRSQSSGNLQKEAEATKSVPSEKLKKDRIAPILKASPLSKLKRIARVFSSLPKKKIKGETQGYPVPSKKVSRMEIEEVKVTEESFEMEPEPEQKPEVKKPKEKKPYQPLIVGKNIYLTGKDGMRKQEKDVEGWDAPEEGDLDHIQELLEERKRIMAENSEFFERKKKEKDEYDKEYDQGKLKKVKKKKKYVQKNNFQKAFEYLNRYKKGNRSFPQK